MSHTLDALLALVAARQHGLVTRADVLRAGGNDTQILRRLRAGRWVRVEHGVYRIAGVPVSWESRLMASVLAAGEGALASHRSALALWDLEVVGRGRPELTIPNGHGYRRRTVACHESLDLHLARPTRRLGIPVTGLRRTLLDAGAVLPDRMVRDAIDVARRRYGLDWDELAHTLVIHSRQGRNGLGALRRVLEEHYEEEGVTDSRFERLAERLLVASGLPAPVFHHPVTVDGNDYELDAAYVEALVGLELDGGHHRTERAFHRDRARQNRLELNGWLVLHYTWRQYLREPGRMVSEVRRALLQRAPRLLLV